MTASKILSWILQLIAATIMLMTLEYKFTADPVSVELFTQLGMEPHGRKLIGALELTAAILLLVPAALHWGALLCGALMTGAIMAHIHPLGFEGDRLELAIYAFAALACSLGIIWLRRERVPFIHHMFKHHSSH